MPRVVYKKVYEHDNRAGGSGNIRKVSFMNGGGGRVFKNRRQDTLIKQLKDDDVEMRGERKLWRAKKNFRKRPGSPNLGNHKVHQLQTSDWYQIRIIFGAKYEQNVILQLLLKHISPEVFCPFGYTTAGRDVIFYIEDFKIAKLFRNANRKILLADGHRMVIKVKADTPPDIPINDNLKEKIKLLMAKRYVPETKALDLSKFSSDPDFTGEVYCPINRPPIMKAIFQIISENISDIMAIKLDCNRISNFDHSISIDVKKLKNLKILHLEGNNIKALHGINCFKDAELTELVLKNNPVIKFYKDYTHYVSEVRKKFPKLTKLDDTVLPPVISFDVVEESKLPAPQAAFMCNPDGRVIVKQFLFQYFALYDSDNRLDLAQAYHDTSSFSLCAYYPQYQKSTATKLNMYFQDSRNLFRVHDFPKRQSRLFMGKQNIIQFLSQLPKTNHDLSSFVVDLTLFTPVLINLTVSGVFREPNPSNITTSWPVRHFSRAFLIVPVGQGFCITNDMLFITNATDTEIKHAFKEETSSSTILQSPSTSNNNSAAEKPPNLSTPVAGNPLQMDDTIRFQMVETLVARTGMNFAWSKKCLDETQWDFDRAIWTFGELQAKGSIPAEAFIK
ncbi:hypothetical protein RUM43_001065 [Polyplax serrata]|uniref:Nuclear RNA export factor 1 n=1 Tax=Polyplax serrata TaxID=468196 RepID=A0AAN8SDT1_POLSC